MQASELWLADVKELAAAIEALLFAAANPLDLAEVKKIFTRLYQSKFKEVKIALEETETVSEESGAAPSELAATPICTEEVLESQVAPADELASELEPELSAAAESAEAAEEVGTTIPESAVAIPDFNLLMDNLTTAWEVLWQEAYSFQDGVLAAPFLSEVPASGEGVLEAPLFSRNRARGFILCRVAESLTFRSHPVYAEVVRTLKEVKPQRLSKAALETLAIVAYRQPVTKAEIDYIRGVDCTGSLKLLLERAQVKIVGKKEEPGRPLLYGTTREFLSFFNLAKLTDLPALRDVHELAAEEQATLLKFDGFIAEHQEESQAVKLLDTLESTQEIASLDAALQNLVASEKEAHEVFTEQGVKFTEENAPS